MGIDTIIASKFSAFISYSHADSAMAKKLHRALESYILPKYLRAKINDPTAESLPALSGKIGPIFRDREDLPAGDDLSQSVKSALQKSSSLIILCSPAAKQSPWVAREITLFRELHPDRPILAAIIHGEPADAFPPPLLAFGREPLAADLRKEGDGWRLGFLKLVAGIANVPLDALIQRDAQRRLKHVMAVTLLSGVALIAMISMTIFAIQSRNEAQAQRAGAEGLVGFMLNDLRSELKGASSLRVMTKVNQRALDYYSDQGDLSDLPDDSLGQRSAILHAMGEDDQKRGDLSAASEKFIQAHRTTKELLERDPENPDRIFDHAQSEYWVGYIAYLKEDWDQTKIYWTAYKTLADDLIASDGKNPKWFQEGGYAEGNLCTYHLAQSDSLDKAIHNCKTAIDHIKTAQKISPSNTDWLKDLANRYAWLANIYQQKNDPEKELEARLIGETFINKFLKNDPLNRDARDIWVRAQISILKNEKDLGIVSERRNGAKIALNTLVKNDPDNKYWKKMQKSFVTEENSDE